MIILKDKNTGEIVEFKNRAAVLEEINRDRSDEWTTFNKNDWKEGLEEFTEFEILAITKGRKQKKST